MPGSQRSTGSDRARPAARLGHAQQLLTCCTASGWWVRHANGGIFPSRPVYGEWLARHPGRSRLVLWGRVNQARSGKSVWVGRVEEVGGSTGKTGLLSDPWISRRYVSGGTNHGQCAPGMARALSITGQFALHRARCTNTASQGRLPYELCYYLMFALHADLHAALRVFHYPATPRAIDCVSVCVHLSCELFLYAVNWLFFGVCFRSNTQCEILIDGTRPANGVMPVNATTL